MSIYPRLSSYQSTSKVEYGSRIRMCDEEIKVVLNQYGSMKVKEKLFSSSTFFGTT